jgi:hypothetical protein
MCFSSTGCSLALVMLCTVSLNGCDQDDNGANNKHQGHCYAPPGLLCFLSLGLLMMCTACLNGSDQAENGGNNRHQGLCYAPARFLCPACLVLLMRCTASLNNRDQAQAGLKTSMRGVAMLRQLSLRCLVVHAHNVPLAVPMSA